MSDLRWFKGNTHTHTNNSDGDAPLENVVRWYREHGYDFVVVTDHNRLTDVSGVQGPGFTVIPGVEYSASSEGRPVHINALNASALPEVRVAEGIVETIRQGVNAVRGVGGVPQINHPNFRWAFTDAEMGQVEGWSLLEILNASTDCNSFGGGGAPGVEAMWDRLLSEGRRVWGVASDDAHDFTKEFWGHRSWPGRAWVMVRASDGGTGALVAALQAGDFYASNEVTLDALEVTEEGVSLVIHQDYQYKYTTWFLGKGGKLVKRCLGNEATYRFKGDEGYVRAKTCSSEGGFAWTQPVFLKKS